jgi:PAS domain S-box-containing protein
MADVWRQPDAAGDGLRVRGAGEWGRLGNRVAALVGSGLYVALDVAVRTVDLPADRSIPWYPPAGVGLATLTLAGPRYAPLLAAARFLAALWPRRFQAPAWALLVEAAVVAVIYAAAAALLRRHVALDGRGWGVKDATWLAGAGLGATAVTGLYASTQIIAWRDFAWSGFWGQMVAWWAADAIGALVVLPLALFIVAPLLSGMQRLAAAAADPAATFRGSPDAAPIPEFAAATAEHPTPRRTDGRTRRIAEYVAQAAAVAAACALVVALRREGHIFDAIGGYVCFVPLTWAALRGGVRGASLVAAAYAVAATALVALEGARVSEVLELQLLLLTLAIVGLFLGAARTAATEGEARYWHLLASANEGVWRADRDWRTVYVNARLADMLGETPQAMAGRHVLEFIHADGREAAHRRFAAAREGLAQTYEITMRHRDGRPVHALVHGSPVRSATTGATLGAVALVTDITPLREAEAGRRRSERLLETAFRTSRDAMALVRADDGVILDVNDRWCELTGASRETLMEWGGEDAAGATWGGLEDASHFLAAIREHGTVRGIETTVRHPGASADDPPDVRHVVLTAYPAVADRTTSYLVTARDVTVERRAEEERGQLQRLEELGRLAGGVAHDFNNLLTAIGSFAELVDEDTRAGRPAESSDVREIRRAVERGRDLTRRLLAFSRHQVVEPRRVDTAAALREAEGLLRSVLGARVELVLDLTEPLPPIMADPGQLDQLLLNLAANARAAMPDGGRLTLAARTAHVAPGDVASVVGPDALPGAYVVLTASDTGTGMSEATQARIFEPFFTTRASGEGTGLGLAVVFGIVRQAHGAIRVESAPGRGATFTVFWPAAPAVPAGAADGEGAGAPATMGPPAAAAGERDPAARPATVLLVDDEDAVREAARRVLERAGFAVVEARHGSEALARLDAMPEPPDVVVTDVAMPVLGGRELAGRLAARWPELPVLLMSGYAGGGDTRGHVREGLPNVCAPVIEKPFAGETLVAAVRRAMDAAVSPASARRAG